MKKLVRDKIPKIMIENGSIPKYVDVSKEDIDAYRMEKLHEEVAEFIENPCAEELADIIEICMKIADVNVGKVFHKLAIKKSNRGGFDTNIVLEFE